MTDLEEEKQRLRSIIEELGDKELFAPLTKDEGVRLGLAQAHLAGKFAQKKARGRGKQTEYRCAKDMGGVVIGRSKAVKVGSEYVQVNCQQPPDVLAPPCFAFECKNRKIAKSISKAMSQAIANAPKDWDAYVWWYDRESEVTYIICTRPTFLGMHGA